MPLAFLSSRRNLLFVLIILVFLSYIPSLNNDFTNWDDPLHVTENRSVVSLDLGGIFSFGNTINRMYIPLTVLSYGIEHHFFKFDPFTYHLNNVLLHIAVVVLIFIFAQHLGLPLRAAFLGALLFGIHPIHVESVAWVTERKDVLYSLFYMLAVLQYYKYIKEKSLLSFLLSIFWGILSLLSKPMALSLPLIFLLMDWFYRRKIDKDTFYDKIPHFLYVIPLTWITYSLFARNPISNAGEAPLIWAWSLTFYIFKFFCPFVYLPLYELPQPVFISQPVYLFSAVFFIAVLTSLVLLRNNRLYVFAWGWYFLSIFFLLRFANEKDFGNASIVADRFMYLPSLGFCLLLGDLFDQWIKKCGFEGPICKRAPVVALSAIFVLLSLKTSRQCDVWENGVKLWSTVVEHYPNMPQGYFDRCDVYIREGKLDLALKDCSKSIELDPLVSSKPFHNRGHIYALTKHYDLALADFDRALALNSQTVYASFTYYSRGTVYKEQKRYDLAIEDFTKSLAIKSDNFRAFTNRAIAYGSKGEYDKASADFDRAIALAKKPEDLAVIYYNRSLFFTAKKEYPKALEDAVKMESLGLHQPEYVKGLEELIKQP